jgi:molybdopterin-guanine dinucleotide biosynthesis protein A
MTTAIILAGGQSRRFGANKLAADLDGRPVLGATIEAVIALVDGVVVAGPELPAGFTEGPVPVALVRDREPAAGPLAALGNVLEHASPAGDAIAIVVAGDMPRLVPGVLELMLERLAGDPGVDAVILAGGAAGGTGGKRQVLPMAVRLAAAKRAAAAALEAHAGSLQALLDRLALVELPGSAWRALDPEGRTVLDVDTPADLDRIRTAKDR